MTSLVDAGRVIRTVSIGGKDVTVEGVSLDGVVLLLDRFPEFKELITPKRGEINPTEFSLEGLIRLSPRIMGAVIAAGLGRPGNGEEEEVAKSLPIGLQIKLIKEIMDVTFPGGLGPFVDDLRSMGLLGLASTPEEQQPSPKPEEAKPEKSADTGKESDMKSLSQQPDSNPKATPK
jgi:hypothetical protein